MSRGERENRREGDKTTAQGTLSKLRYQKNSVRNVGETKAVKVTLMSFEILSAAACCYHRPSALYKVRSHSRQMNIMFKY